MIGAKSMLMIMTIGMPGILFFVIGLYAHKKRIDFERHGIPTTFIVKDVIVEETYDEDSGKITKKFKTIFEFTHNREVLEETLDTKKEYEIGQRIEGLYIPTAKTDNITMKGAGFYAAKNTEYIVMGIGILLIIAGFSDLFINR